MGKGIKKVQEQKAKRRFAGGLTDEDFIIRSDVVVAVYSTIYRAEQKLHLKAYLKGKEFYGAGYPNMKKVEEQWVEP